MKFVDPTIAEYPLAVFIFPYFGSIQAGTKTE